jgi:hypothetical protein
MLVRGIVVFGFVVALTTTGCERRPKTYSGVEPNEQHYPQVTEPIDPHVKH